MWFRRKLTSRLDWGQCTAYLVLALAMLANLALASHDLAGRPFTEDEAASRNFATLPHGSGVLSDGGSMAFYYLLLRITIEIFGSSIATMRFLSVLAGTLTVPLIFLIGRRAANARVGMFACALFAVSLPALYWQQSARGYALEMFLACASTLAFLVLVAESSVRSAPYAYVVFTSLAFYTSFFILFVVLAQLLSLLAHRRGSVPVARVSIALAVTLACCAPLAVAAAQQGTEQIAWLSTPGPGALLATGRMLMSAASADGTNTSSSFAPFLGYGSLSLCLGGIIYCLARRANSTQEERSAVTLAASWLLLPPLAAFGISLFSTHIYLDRYFTICLPGAALVLAIVIDRAKAATFAYTAVVLLIVLRFAVIPSSYETVARGHAIDRAEVCASANWSESPRPKCASGALP